MSLLLAIVLAAAPDVSGTYRIETSKAPIKVKKGGQASAHVEVVPRADAHVSPDAPISLTVSSGPAVKIAKAKLGRPEAKETKARGVEFEVPFTAQNAGKDEIKGTLSFFICTEQLCERQKRELALAVEVE
ncbi:MAG: hypothetical protein E6J78_16530 [Deltaproteobacteria bacterium]|nr:MAG: hypothetical protein E6J78_16530 [Deltaproteobacteria bacterium]